MEGNRVASAMSHDEQIAPKTARAQKSLNKNKLISYARKNKNLIITPHIGGATHESVEKTDFFVIKKFLKI